MGDSVCAINDKDITGISVGLSDFVRAIRSCGWPLSLSFTCKHTAAADNGLRDISHEIKALLGIAAADRFPF